MQRRWFFVPVGVRLWDTPAAPGWTRSGSVTLPSGQGREVGGVPAMFILAPLMP
jgi:hypothetical protein